MERAEAAVRQGELALREGDCELAVNRAYYAAFYAATALLETRGLQTSRHSATLRLFGREFVEQGLMAGSHGKTLNVLFRERQKVDYTPAPDVAGAQAAEHLHSAREFVADAEALLGNIPGEG
ncbi:MAG: HEPN domain-containing protein [Armatimonadota bacterium]|nr:HEPN domain-containing protein [Armatimonadota bacterium]